MHGAEFLEQVTILFGTALAVAWAFRFFRAPSIIGFLITGIVIGPSALGLIDEHQVANFAEVGLVLLLFTIGLELSPKPLLRAGPRLFLATVGQIAVTSLAPALFMVWLTPLGLLSGIILGIGIALSSTAIVLKTLSDQGEVRSAMGNICTGFLLLQDVFVIIVMLALPFLAASGGGNVGAALGKGGGGLAAIVVVTIVLRKLLPFILAQVTRHGGHELTTLFAVFMAAGGAFFVGALGWPPALGACVAGLLLAEADLRHQLVAEITPFRDLFNALFFISLGMLVQLDIVMEYWWLLAIAIAATLVLKALIVGGIVVLAGWPTRLGVQVGLGLCTVSEFGYVLAREANQFGLLPDQALAGLIPYSVGTMLVGALMVPLSGRVVALIMGRGEATDEAGAEHEEHGVDLSSHVVIVGYGVNGKNLVKVLTSTRVPHCVIEMSRPLAKAAREDGAEVIVGDAARASILNLSALSRARVLVVAINDTMATRRVVAQARALHPTLYIIARTEYAAELDHLYKNGANMVVPADFEVSIKIFAQVLTEFKIPDNVIQAQIESVRAGGYGLLRGVTLDQPEQLQELLQVFRLTATQTYYVSDQCPIADQTIAEVDLRKKSGVSIIAVVREGQPTTNPPADFQVKRGDVLVMVGTHAQLGNARGVLDGTS